MPVLDFKTQLPRKLCLAAIRTVIDNITTITMRADRVELFVFPLSCDEKTLQGKRKILNWRCDYSLLHLKELYRFHEAA